LSFLLLAQRVAPTELLTGLAAPPGCAARPAPWWGVLGGW